MRTRGTISFRGGSVPAAKGKEDVGRRGIFWGGGVDKCRSSFPICPFEKFSHTGSFTCRLCCYEPGELKEREESERGNFNFGNLPHKWPVLTAFLNFSKREREREREKRKIPTAKRFTSRRERVGNSYMVEINFIYKN